MFVGAGNNFETSFTSNGFELCKNYITFKLILQLRLCGHEINKEWKDIVLTHSSFKCPSVDKLGHVLMYSIMTCDPMQWIENNPSEGGLKYEGQFAQVLDQIFSFRKEYYIGW